MHEIVDCKKPFHKHLMLRGYCDHSPTSTDEVVTWLTEFIDFLGMKKLQGPFSSYVDAEGNRGITAVAMIETSHIAFHLWDEQKPSLLQFDVYTCGSLDADSTLGEIRRYFKIVEDKYLIYDRENGFELLAAGQYKSGN